MAWDNLPILIILVLAVLGHNQTVSVAAAVLLLIKLLGFNDWLPIIESKGLNIGVIILTMSILVPIVSGRITIKTMAEAVNTPAGIAAIVAGIFVAWAAGRGLFMIKTTPEVISSLIIGTIVGVCFLGGVAVGPLIAAGLVYLFMAVFGMLT